MAQLVPSLIQNNMAGWEDYCDSINALHPEDLLEVYQKYADSVS